MCSSQYLTHNETTKRYTTRDHDSPDTHILRALIPEERLCHNSRSNSASRRNEESHERSAGSSTAIGRGNRTSNVADSRQKEGDQKDRATTKSV